MTDQEKKDQILRIFDAFNRHDVDGLDECFGPDYVDHGPLGEIPGGEPFKDFAGAGFATFPGRLDDEGRPAEHWTGNDMLALLTQLGVIPDMTPAHA